MKDLIFYSIVLSLLVISIRFKANTLKSSNIENTYKPYQTKIDSYKSYEQDLQVICFTVNLKDTIHKMYIEKYAALAILEHKKYGIPASIKLAQMIHESGFNETNPKGSKLVQEGHNPFGIKYFGDYKPNRIPQWDELAFTGIFILAKDDCLLKDCKFIRFKGMWHAFRYHSILLAGTEQNPSHYSKHITTGDWEDWTNALKQGGYATAEDYDIKIRTLILNYKLYLLDNHQQVL
jgi:flagellum-specific peptidoglycan hydrolase FlgJ